MDATGDSGPSEGIEGRQALREAPISISVCHHSPLKAMSGWVMNLPQKMMPNICRLLLLSQPIDRHHTYILPSMLYLEEKAHGNKVYNTA